VLWPDCGSEVELCMGGFRNDGAILIEEKSAITKDDNSFNGTRKLIRPQLPARRREFTYGEDPLSHAMMMDTYSTLESSHAEAFYFQKQIQLQTDMTFVLEDGEELHGVIEWYDKCVVKLKVGRSRIMVYKASVKYLYKTSDANVSHPVMK
jgi:sRNA-binding regulator protein Hfq